MAEDISCHVVYLDQRHNAELRLRHGEMPPLPEQCSTEKISSTATENPLLDRSLTLLLEIFHEVYVCKTATSCFAKIESLVHAQERRVIPVLVLLDIPQLPTGHDSHSSSTATGKLGSGIELDPHEELYGRPFLLHLAAEIQRNRLPKLVVPVAILRRRVTNIEPIIPPGDSPASNVTEQAETSRQRILANSNQALSLLEGGASDVLFSPFSKDRLEGLAVQALRAHRDATTHDLADRLAKRNRKRPWVGIDERQPFEYLREKMSVGCLGIS